MTGRLKVVTLVGTRPELIKLSRVIPELDRTMDQVFVHSGQNDDPALGRDLLDDLGLRPPDQWLGAGNASPMETLASLLPAFDRVLEETRPDAMLFYGDTNTGLAALAAKRRRVPIFHMEAGNRCYDERVPEEVNRRVLDHLSDINLPLSEHARRCLLAEGLRPDRIVKTGSALAEVLHHHREGIAASGAPADLGLTRGRFFLVSVHRQENVDDPLRLARLLDMLAALAAEWGWPVVVSTHPRTARRLETLGTIALPDAVRLARPFRFTDYVALQLASACVLSDSGSLTEEAAILGLPAVVLREQHERPEGTDAGTTVMAGIDRARVLQAVALVLDQRRTVHAVADPVADYASLGVAAKVARTILGYTDYVNRTVWRRETP